MTERQKQLRKRLLSWHYSKSKSISILDLLESSYQGFRMRVGSRLDNLKIDFREAIKKASGEELERLEHILDEERAEKSIRRK